jgi:hypothetical protein
VEGALVGGLSFLAALYYPKQLPPIRRGHDRINRLRRERCVQQVANGPDAIRDALGDRWRGAQLRGDVHTNSIEGIWANVKRGIKGTYVHVSQKHLQTYPSRVRVSP